MNDEELPTNAEMASAYLDGELDATERAAVVADPGTMALVDTFARVRSTLGKHAPVADSTRTAAISAALVEFDAILSATRVTPAARSPKRNVTSMHWLRMRSYRLLPRLAAAAVVVVIGVAAFNNTRQDDASLSSATVAPAAIDAGTEQPTVEAPAPASKAQDTTAAASAESGVLAADSAIAAVPTIDSPDALAEYASTFDARDSTASPASSPTTVAPLAAPAELPNVYALPPCIAADDTVLGAIIFQGVQAFAVRHTLDSTVRAIDAVDCHVLVSVAP